MKACILTIALIVSLASCQEENEVVYSVDPALEPYVSSFYAEAVERGVSLPRNLVAEFKVIQGQSKIDRNHDQNLLYIHPVMFDSYKAEGLEAQIEAHVFYRLGGLLLRKDISEGLSFMNPDFMFEPYNPENKEAMLDALFENP